MFIKLLTSTVLIKLLDPETDPDPNSDPNPNPNPEQKFRIRIRIRFWLKKLGSSRIRIRIRIRNTADILLTKGRRVSQNYTLLGQMILLYSTIEPMAIDPLHLRLASCTCIYSANEN